MGTYTKLLKEWASACCVEVFTKLEVSKHGTGMQISVFILRILAIVRIILSLWSAQNTLMSVLRGSGQAAAMAVRFAPKTDPPPISSVLIYPSEVPCSTVHNREPSLANLDAWI